MNRLSYNALLRRGISSDIAESLIERGYNMASLKQMNRKDLLLLDIGEEFADKILRESRPPIPEKTVCKLLIESKYTCCICGDNTRAIIIHHINSWEETHSHDEDNLVVLCLQHHDEAHTKHSLSINLTADRIKVAKEAWIKQVQEQSVDIIREIISDSSSSVWDYLNLYRIYEIASKIDIDMSNNKHHQNLLRKGYINEDGLIELGLLGKAEGELSYWTDFGDGYMVRLYLEELFNNLITRVNIKILNEIWSKREIAASIKAGDIILVQGAFSFRKLEDKNSGKGQMRLAYRKAKGIKVEFQFDAWESTSITAKNCHLRGRCVNTAIAIVRNISFEKELRIMCTALGMGTGFVDLSGGRFFPEGFFLYSEEAENEELYADEL